MLVAALGLVLEWGPERIQAYAKELNRHLLEEAESLGYAVEEAPYRVDHLFGIRMPKGVEMGRLKEALQRENVSTSLRGSALRVSPHIYNVAGDVDALRRALRAGVKA
jgi:selenocysteine lyase/cysteine desulfurase